MSYWQVAEIHLKTVILHKLFPNYITMLRLHVSYLHEILASQTMLHDAYSLLDSFRGLIQIKVIKSYKKNK